MSAHRRDRNAEIEAIALKADEWLMRMESTDPQVRAEYLAWLKQSPLHIREALFASTWSVVLRRALDPERLIDIETLTRDRAPDIVPFGGDDRQHVAVAAAAYARPHANRGTRWLVGIAMAACLSIAVALNWSLLTHLVRGGQEFSTAIGEQRSIALTDGSVMYMNTQSRARVDFSDAVRDVYLDGQATFKVKADTKRPFRVHAGATLVQAIGTQFDVHRREQRTSVAVIEGTVQVTAKNAGSIQVPAGESLVVAADGKRVSRKLINVAEASAWQRRTVVFRNDTLADIAQEFNRYNRTPQIRIEGTALAMRRYTGVLDAGDWEGLIQLLANENLIAVDRTGDEIVIHLRSSR